MRKFQFVALCIVAISVTINLIAINNTLSEIKENTAQQYCVDTVDEDEVINEDVES